MKSETELRDELRQVETQMGGIVRRVKSVDAVLNVNLSSPHAPGSVAAIKEYLAWLDGVEALGLSYVNGNIVTQRLRLFYTRPEKRETRDSDPYPRMREVKNLLEAVRHKDQANLVLLRARRHTLNAQIQKLERDTRSRAGRQSGFGELKRRIQSAIWLQITVVVLIILFATVLFESFKPEIIHFVRTTVGLRDGPPGPAAVSTQEQGRPRTGRERGLSGLER
ncbi:MAG: hypothetical protein ABSB63_05905 [Spirochaetia bacterium]|jgi:hypothetical protein